MDEIVSDFLIESNENLDQLDWTNLTFRESVSGGKVSGRRGSNPKLTRRGTPEVACAAGVIT